MLSLDWVERIFEALSVAYGTRFVSQYGTTPPESVKRHWASVLDGFTSGHVKHALDNLPPDHPPNAMQFRALGRGRPLPEPVKELPPVKAQAETVARAMAAVAPMRAKQSPKAWAWALKAREERGERITQAQRTMWRTALSASLGTTET